MTAVPKVRLRFAKRGDLRLVSHHDLVRCVERALRRAALPVATSQGFNPRPRVTFALALALGIEGRREVVEIDLAEPMEPAEVLSRLAATSPPGLDWLGAEPAPSNRAAQATAAGSRLDLPESRRAAASAALAELLASASRPYARRRPDRVVELDLRPFLLDAEIDPLGGALRFRLKVTNSGAAARPEDIVDVLGLSDLTRGGAVLTRTEIELAPAPGPDRPGPTPPAPTPTDRPVPERPAPAGATAAGADDPPTDTPTTAPASERPTA